MFSALTELQYDLLIEREIDGLDDHAYIMYVSNLGLLDETWTYTSL